MSKEYDSYVASGKYQVGDVVVITFNSNAHCFAKGDVVILDNVGKKGQFAPGTHSPMHGLPLSGDKSRSHQAHLWECDVRFLAQFGSVEAALSWAKTPQNVAAAKRLLSEEDSAKYKYRLGDELIISNQKPDCGHNFIKGEHVVVVAHRPSFSVTAVDARSIDREEPLCQLILEPNFINITGVVSPPVVAAPVVKEPEDAVSTGSYNEGDIVRITANTNGHSISIGGLALITKAASAGIFLYGKASLEAINLEDSSIFTTAIRETDVKLVTSGGGIVWTLKHLMTCGNHYYDIPINQTLIKKICPRYGVDFIDKSAEYHCPSGHPGTPGETGNSFPLPSLRATIPVLIDLDS